MTTAIYARCSSEESAVKGLYIKDQVERCKKKAKELGLEVSEVFKDEGFSAGVESRERRPAFDEMISKAKSGAFDHILCLDTSRFSRDPIEAETFERLLERQGTTIIYIPLPDAGPYTEIVRAFFRVMDRFHSITSRVKSLQGLEQNIKQGFRAGGRAPFGYRLKRHHMGIKPDGSPYYRTTLEPDESPAGDDLSKAEAIAHYFQRRAEGYGRRTILKELREREISISDNGSGNVSTLIGWEDNIDTYLGHTVWNKARKGGYAKDKSEWLIKENTHPPLITESTGEAVKSRRRKGLQGKREFRYAFNGGILICAECGSKFVASQGNYACYGRRFKGKSFCDNEGIKAEILEHNVAEIVQEIYSSEDKIAGIVKALQKKQENEQSHLPKLRKELSRAKEEYNRWNVAYQKGKIDLEYFAETGVPLRNEIKALEDKIEKERAVASTPAETADLVRSHLKNLTNHHSLLSKFVSQIRIHKKANGRRDVEVSFLVPRQKALKLQLQTGWRPQKVEEQFTVTSLFEYKGRMCYNQFIKDGIAL